MSSSSSSSTSTSTTGSSSQLTLAHVVKELTGFAPLDLAGSWDNVGLLLEPSPASSHVIRHITLTNDLTAPVLAEACANNTSLIISYHPPIFSAWKRLTHADPKQSLILTCAHHNIAIYSPHTTWDAAQHGVNDWLASGCGTPQEIQSVRVLEPARDPSSPAYLLRVYCSSPSQALLAGFANLGVLPADPAPCAACDTDANTCTADSTTTTTTTNTTTPICTSPTLFYAHKSHLPHIEACVQQHAPGTAWDVSALEARVTASRGQGRLVTLTAPIPLSTFIARVKAHLSLTHVQVSIPYTPEHKQQDPQDVPLRTIAICAGSGASVVGNTKADVYWTGEMGHHDVLAAQTCGTCVVLCHHSNTERGYLRMFRDILTKRLQQAGHNNIPIAVSASDRDPLVIL